MIGCSACMRTRRTTRRAQVLEAHAVVIGALLSALARLIHRRCRQMRLAAGPACIRRVSPRAHTIPHTTAHTGTCSGAQSINLLLFLQKQNLATAIYLFGLGTLLTGLGLKHMRICSHHDLVGALVTSLFLGRPWWSTTSPTCLPLSVFTITSDQHRCRIPPLL